MEGRMDDGMDNEMTNTLKSPSFIKSYLFQKTFGFKQLHVVNVAFRGAI
jgi:hypothetical protein